MATGVSKAEYLKRYLSGEDVNVGKKKKKKKPKPVAKIPSSRIVDDDADSTVLLPENLSNTLEEDVGDEEPTIADFIDERPEDVKQMEVFRNENKWKVITENSSGRRTRYDSDESPLRDPSENVDQGSAESDQSPRRRRRYSDSDQLPPQQSSSKTAGGRHDSDSESDQSPPRKLSKKSRHSDADSDQCPPRKTERTKDNRSSRYSDSDQSPPRRSSKKNRLSDARRGSDSDQSPPRKSHRSKDSSSVSRYSDPDQSPPRRSTKKSRFSEVGKHSDSDQSPPRKTQRDSKNRRHSESDQSPPRRSSKKSRFSDARQFDSDQSPPRKTQRNRDSKNKRHSDSDHSPPRRSSKKSRFSDARRRSDSDQSPPRNSSKMKDLDQKGRASKTLSGATAGLQSARAMKEEAERLKKRENESFKQISDERLGKNAGTVFRDKSGKRRNFKEEKRKEREEEAKKAEQVEKYAQWGKGLKQQEEQDSNVASALHEMSKPLARYKDDRDLDEELKALDREGDPMLAFIKKKKSKTSSGPAKPRYNGPRQPPPNRFGIWPGFRWDGVDRSNGFEKQFFAKKAEKKAVREMAYKWSVEDM